MSPLFGYYFPPKFSLAQKELKCSNFTQSGHPAHLIWFKAALGIVFD